MSDKRAGGQNKQSTLNTEVTKPIEKTPERVSSVPPVRKLSPIQERPLYNDLRRERMEKKINTINSLKLF